MRGRCRRGPDDVVLVGAGGSALGQPQEPKAYRLKVDAVAYSLPGSTALGVPVRKGVVAVDPKLIPLGTQHPRTWLRPGACGGRRNGDQGSDHRPLVPEHGQGARVGPAHGHDHDLPVAPPPPSAASATQFDRETRARHAGSARPRGCGRRRDRVDDRGSAARARDRARTRAESAGHRSAADRCHRARPPDRGHRVLLERPPLPAPRVRGEARGLVLRAARARPRLQVPNRGPRRRISERPRLGRRPLARRVR